MNDGGVGVADHLDHYDTAALRRDACRATIAGPVVSDEFSKRCPFSVVLRTRVSDEREKWDTINHWGKKKESATTNCYKSVLMERQSKVGTSLTI
jgi:hypothetical protein